MTVRERAKPTPSRKNLTAWQAYNRRRWQFEKDVLPLDERMPFVCECTRGECFQVIELTAPEYESAHMFDHWTAVAPEHILADDHTRVAVRHPHFWVVELLL